MGSMSLTEKILEVLKQLAQEDVYEILSFDVKDGEEPGGAAYHEKYMSKAKQCMETLGWNLSGNWDNMTPWQKICIYKVSGSKGVDCDVALRNVVIYALAYGLLEEGWKIEEQNKRTWHYQLRAQTRPAWVLRGDTMNSYQTTIHEFIRSSPQMDEMKKRGIFYENPSKPNGKPLSDWEAAFLQQYEYCKTLLPSFAFVFIRQIDTLGNFIPVPFISNNEGAFNSPRGCSSSKDYWDLALVCLYNYYAEKAGHAHITNNGQKIYTLEWMLRARDKDPEKRDCKTSANVNLCKEWLDRFGSWNHFVEKNFLQDFVNQEGGGYGQPKELWFGHFDGESLPKKQEEFDTFFRNASSQIIARGLRIAMAAKDYLQDKNLEQLAKQMI